MTWADVLPIVALVAMLLAAYRHLPDLGEAVVGLVAVGVALGSGLLGGHAARAALTNLAPVVVFLAAILVVAECCRSAGLFAALGDRLAGVGTARGLLGATFALATLTTVVLSLDATVVLLPPVVVAAGRAARLESRPAALATVRLANSASTLLPVANLTNLVALRFLDVGFGRFALLMAPSWLLILAVEHTALRLRFRRLLDEHGTTTSERRPLPRLPLVAVALMLAAFALTSPYGVQPAWPAVLTALVLGAVALHRRQSTAGRLLASAHLGFCVYVLCLGVVVAAVTKTFLGDWLRDGVPDQVGHGGGAVLTLLGLAALGAVTANVVNNLPATLVLAPLVAPLGVTALLALLIGINLGSSLTWTGSLANLLWRRTLRHAGVTASAADFHLTALLAAPVGIIGGVVLLELWSRLV